METMTWEQLDQYKAKLIKGLLEYMASPATERSANGVRGMIECWLTVDNAAGLLCKGEGSMTEQDAKAWAARMDNADGTTGAHWTMEETTAVGDSIGIEWSRVSKCSWWVAMCMMYSDYGPVAERYGVATAEFFADLARAFLFDKDGPGPEDKLSAYHCAIAKGK